MTKELYVNKFSASECQFVLAKCLVIPSKYEVEKKKKN